MKRFGFQIGFGRDLKSIASWHIGCCDRHMRFVRVFSIFLLACVFIAQTVHAQNRGPGEGGGGDPEVSQFLFLSRKLEAFFRENPRRLELPFSASRFTELVRETRRSFEEETLRDLVEFKEEPLTDADGVSKPAVFDRETGVITVHRPYWRAASDEARLILITMEYAGRMTVDSRYESVPGLIRGHVALILGMAIDEQSEKTPIGWWIASQDPNIFARLSHQDLILDGGIIGTGSESNARVVRFLSDPLQNTEWIEHARAAFARGKNAYLMLRDESGSRASLTAFFERPSARSNEVAGVATYTLLFYSDGRPPVGQCSHQSNTLSPLERLRNCFFNGDHYQLFDNQESAAARSNDPASLAEAWRKAFGGLNRSLTLHYSSSPHALSAALRSALIQDYSGVISSPFAIQVKTRSLRAHGLSASLGRGETAFWEKSGEPSEIDQRFFRALRVLAESRLGYFDGLNPRCLEIGRDGQPSVPHAPPAGLLPLARLRELESRFTCHFRDGTYFVARFYRAMANYGFVYRQDRWERRSPRNVFQELMIGSNDLTQEIETQIVVGDLNSESARRLIEGELRHETPERRLSIYADVFKNLARLGVTDRDEEALYRSALRDFTNLAAQRDPSLFPEPGRSSIRYWEAPARRFVRSSMGLAVTGHLVSVSFSADFLTALMSSAFFDENLAQEFIEHHFLSSRSYNTYPFFRSGLRFIMESPVFDEKVAMTLARSVVASPFSVLRHRPTYMHSYADLFWLASSLLISGQIDAQAQEALHALLPTLQAGMEFERRSATLPDPEDRAQVLSQMMGSSSFGPAMAEVVTQFLITQSLRSGLRGELIDQLLKRLQTVPSQNLVRPGLSETGGAYMSLLALLFRQGLTHSEQEAIGTFIAQRTDTLASFHVQVRSILQTNLTGWMQPTELRFPGAQRILEALAETAFAEPHELLIPAQFEGEWSLAGKLLRDLPRCTVAGSQRPRWCEDVTSVNTIYSRLAANSRLPEALRMRAIHLLQP